MIVLVPLVWGLLRRGQGLPMFGAPTVAELEGEQRVAERRPEVVDRPVSPSAS